MLRVGISPFLADGELRQLVENKLSQRAYTIGRIVNGADGLDIALTFTSRSVRASLADELSVDIGRYFDFYQYQDGSPIGEFEEWLEDLLDATEDARRLLSIETLGGEISRRFEKVSHLVGNLVQDRNYLRRELKLRDEQIWELEVRVKALQDLLSSHSRDPQGPEAQASLLRYLRRVVLASAGLTGSIGIGLIANHLHDEYEPVAHVIAYVDETLELLDWGNETDDTNPE